MKNINSDNHSNPIFDEEDNPSFNILEWIMRFIKYWYLFVISVLIFMAVAYYQNRSFVPTYNSTLRMLLKQESGSLSYMQNMTQNFGVVDKTNIENQILLLRSQDLIARTIDSLPQFSIDFYKKKQFKNVPLYGRSPISIEIINIYEEGYYMYYSYKKRDSHSFTITIYDNTDNEIETIEGTFNEPIGCKYFLVKVIPNSDFMDLKTVNFQFRTRQSLISEFFAKLQIRLIENTSVLDVSVNSDNPARDVDFLTQHAKSFLGDNLDKKNYEADKTIQFINSQLSIISDSLTQSESNLNSFKIANNMYGENNTTMLTSKMDELQQVGKQIRLRDEYFKYLRNYLKSNIDRESLASPATLGIQEPRLIALVDKYNELQIKLLDLGAKNPQYEVVSGQIAQIKNQLNELMASVDDVYKIEKNSYHKDLEQLNRLLMAGPTKNITQLTYTASI